MATLLDWVAPGASTPVHSDGCSLLPLIKESCAGWRDHTVSFSAGGLRAIRTRGWCLQETPDGINSGPKKKASRAPKRQLFVRPDDYHEVNDVADLRREIVTGLAEAVRLFERACQQNKPLDRLLIDADLGEPAN